MSAENNEKGKSKIVSGLLWKLLELGGTQGIQFVVSIILARLLSPDEFGTISLITIFITIANTFVQSGFTTALIQKKDVEDPDYSSVFWISMLLAVVMYLLLWAAAPAIAAYYAAPVLTDLLRATGVILFPGAVVSIQTAYVSRNMQFRKLFLASLIAVVISGGAAIGFALRGFGVWAMSLQQIIFYFALMIALFAVVSWKPAFELKILRIKELISFGWKILAAGLLDTIWANVYGLVIGKRFSTADLGGYNRGEQFPRIIATNLSSALQSVMLPVYSRLQDDRARLKDMLQSTIRYSAFFLFPMMAGLIAVAEPLVRVLLTDKWLFCVPYLRLLAACYVFWPVHTVNLQAINAQGKSGLFLKLEIAKKISGIIFLCIGLLVSPLFGVTGILIFRLVHEIVCSVLNSHPNKPSLGYGFLAQISDMVPAGICSAGMCLGTMAVGKLVTLSPLPLLLLQVAAGIIFYITLSLIFNKEPVHTLMNHFGPGPF